MDKEKQKRRRVSQVAARTTEGTILCVVDHESNEMTFFKRASKQVTVEEIETRQKTVEEKHLRPKRKKDESDAEYESRRLELEKLIEKGKQDKFKDETEEYLKEVVKFEKIPVEKISSEVQDEKIGSVPFYGRRLTAQIARQWAQGFVQKKITKTQ